MTLEQLFPNPDYGTGMFLRGVRLTHSGRSVFGELEDSMHAMRCRLDHDGTKVTAIEPEFIRLPMTTCPGARTNLQSVVGVDLCTPLRSFYGEGRPRENCTHLYDLAWWMIAHTQRTESQRRYEVVIPDRPQRTGPVTLLRNDEEILRWIVTEDVIEAPSLFAGRSILRSFTQWALTNFDGDFLEAILFTQKAFFVSKSREIDIPALAGPLKKEDEAMKGVCWSFSSPQFESARRVNSERRLSDRRELFTFSAGPSAAGAVRTGKA